MIDWYLTSRILSDVLGADPRSLARIDESMARAPKFQNKPHALAISPIVLDAAAVRAARPSLESYVALVEHVVRLYRHHAEVRAFFDLPRDVADLVVDEPALERNVVICRLDGYLTADEQRLVLLENNADSPAGTLFTGRLNRLVRQGAGELSRAMERTRPSDFDTRPAFWEALLGAYRQNGGSVESPEVVILQIDGQSNLESREMVEEFRSQGVRCRLADPRAIVVRDGAAYVDDTRVDLVWNKINTVFWNDLVRESPELLRTFRVAVERRLFVHVNPFATRYVAENKLCIPFLQEPRFASLFSAEQRSLARTLLPWATKLESGKLVEFRGQRWSLDELVASQQSSLVLKQPYDIRGDGVTIGRCVSTEEWRKRVEAARGAGGSVQEYIRPCTAPIALLDGGVRVRSMNLSLDTFVFGGKVVGFGSKASLNDKVNVFQGGSKVSITTAAPTEEP